MAKKINRRGRGGSQGVVIFLCVLCGFPDCPEKNKKSLKSGRYPFAWYEKGPPKKNVSFGSKLPGWVHPMFSHNYN